MSTAMFLSNEEISCLTGRKMKGAQIDALRHMGIPFFVNATGHPVVTRMAVEGSPKAEQKPVSVWTPQVLNAA